VLCGTNDDSNWEALVDLQPRATLLKMAIWQTNQGVARR
jgi:hypothetical protein